jgi:hypothetical protein
MPGIPCFALLLFLLAALIRRILASIDARQQRPSARQPGVRPTPTIRTSLATLIARCWLAAQSAAAVAVLPGSQPDSTLPRAFGLRSSCSRPSPPPRPRLRLLNLAHLHHRRRRDHDAGASLLRCCLTCKCRTRGRICSMSTDLKSSPPNSNSLAASGCVVLPICTDTGMGGSSASSSLKAAALLLSLGYSLSTLSPIPLCLCNFHAASSSSPRRTT